MEFILEKMRCIMEKENLLENAHSVLPKYISFPNVRYCMKQASPHSLVLLDDIVSTRPGTTAVRAIPAQVSAEQCADHAACGYLQRFKFSTILVSVCVVDVQSVLVSPESVETSPLTKRVKPRHAKNPADRCGHLRKKNRK